MQDRLFRSRTDRVIGGICGGLAKYFELDPVIVRLVAVLLAMSGIGIPLYIVLWLVIPTETAAYPGYRPPAGYAPAPPPNAAPSAPPAQSWPYTQPVQSEPF